MKKIGFDDKKYRELTKEEINKRLKKFSNKLYLEIGGKLFDDLHASRILPGFKYNSKIEILKELKDKTEVIVCISAKDIEKRKMRADYDITYDKDVMRIIDNIRKNELKVNSVVITLFENENSAINLKNKLEFNGIKVYMHSYTEGYPGDIEKVVSENGYGKNEYIETEKPLVVVTAPGPGSGKLATCLSQLYHEYKRKNKAGYAKFETFPVWNLPLKHPVNIAYEVATADLKDVNMIDSFHLEHYGETAVNYNRDIETFPILRKILKEITKEEIYHSPTDMGINMIGFAITNEKVIINACVDEIIRRYYKSLVSYKMGEQPIEVTERIKILMNELNIDVNKRKVVKYAHKKQEEKKSHSMAIELEDGTIITGRTTDIMSAPASTLINALKYITNLDEDVYIISPLVIEPMLKIKKDLFHKNEVLNLQEILLALSINAATNPIIAKMLESLNKLNNCEAHATYILTNGDAKPLKQLKINYTCDPEFKSNDLFIND